MFISVPTEFNGIDPEASLEEFFRLIICNYIFC